MSTTKTSWRTPTVILVVGCIILTLSMGVRHTAGLFLQPMTLDHGWSRELFSFSIALQNLLWGVFQPFAGAFADRHGAVDARDHVPGDPRTSRRGGSFCPGMGLEGVDGLGRFGQQLAHPGTVPPPLARWVHV